MNEVEYVVCYTVFVFFFLYVTTQGAPTFLSAEGVTALQSIQITRTIHAPDYVAGGWTCGWGIFDFICTTLGGIVKLLWNIGVFFYWTFTTIWDFLQTFFILLKFSSEVKWFTVLVITPMTIGLIYVIAKLVRGGG
jgi:hypothetical protein